MILRTKGTSDAQIDHCSRGCGRALRKRNRTFDDQALTIKTRNGYDDVTGLGTPNGMPFLTRI